MVTDGYRWLQMVSIIMITLYNFIMMIASSDGVVFDLSP